MSDLSRGMELPSDSPMRKLMERRPKRGQASPDFDLRERLKRLGIKQVHFADYIGRDHSGLRRWIAGNPPPPGEVEMLIDLLDHHLLGQPEPAWLLAMKQRYAGGGAEEEQE